MATLTETLHRTPFYDLHVKLGARIVPFAGYEMPVQYPTGILAEHNWTRSSAGLFDVSHMGQAHVTGPDHQTAAMALERLVPGDVLGLAERRIRYTQITNAEGGIIDDLMITRTSADDGRLYIVVNASRKDVDYAWIAQHLAKECEARADRGSRAGRLAGSEGGRRSWPAIAPRLPHWSS